MPNIFFLYGNDEFAIARKLKEFDSDFTDRTSADMNIDQKLSFRVAGGMGGAGRESEYREQAVFWTVNSRLEYWLPKIGEKMAPYVVGGAGLVLYKRAPGQTGLDDHLEKIERRTMISGGAGVDYKLGSASIFL